MPRPVPPAHRVPTEELRLFCSSLHAPTPQELYDALGRRGYVGQDAGRRALALMAYRHVRRLRWLYLDEVPRDQLPPKENLLLVGPTGCGKTFAVELLFRELLGLATCIVDVTTLSETGYVGNDVSSVLTRLLFASGMSPGRAALGVICLDEFDKIAGGGNRAVFAGAGTTKDVTGLGVQRELLKLLEASEVPVSTGLDHSSMHQQLLMRTDDIAFVAAGAFSGLKTVTARRAGGGVGFGRAGGREEIAVRYTGEELDDIGAFQAYGFLPELIGRFNRIVGFDPLEREALRDVLLRRVLPGRRREFELAGMRLEVDDAVLEHLVDRAVKRETGARGLGAELGRALEDAAFEAYSKEGCKRVVLRLREGRIDPQVER